MMKALVPFVALAAFAATAAARPPWTGGGPGAGMGGPRAFVQHLFAPPLVMQNQEKIGLDEAQRTAIRAAMKDTQAALLDLQWRLDAESEKLEALLAADHPDETAAMAQVDRVLAVEADVKKAHLRLLIRIKRLLTPEQQERLRALRRTRGEDAPPPAP